MGTKKIKFTFDRPGFKKACRFIRGNFREGYYPTVRCIELKKRVLIKNSGWYKTPERAKGWATNWLIKFYQHG